MCTSTVRAATNTWSPQTWSRSWALEYIFFFKQKTAYEMRTDWSSDVCSSDLGGELLELFDIEQIGAGPGAIEVGDGPLGALSKLLVDHGAERRHADATADKDHFALGRLHVEIGRASCRERVCVWVGGGWLSGE